MWIKKRENFEHKHIIFTLNLEIEHLITMFLYSDVIVHWNCYICVIGLFTKIK